MLTMKINATNDTNGNPRRGWLCYKNGGEFLGFVDEGYKGWPAVALAFPRSKIIIELSCVDCTPEFYRDHERKAVNR